MLHSELGYRTNTAWLCCTDKVPPDERESANVKFQEIAFAYAILSDLRRRARYDATGRTSDLPGDGDDPFDWASFYRAQFADIINEETISKFSKEYKNSPEERMALLDAFTRAKGNMNKVYEEVMLSNPLEDEKRFRKILDQAIKAGDVHAFTKFRNESPKSVDRRMQKAKKEAREAEKAAKEMGLDKDGADTVDDTGANPGNAGLAAIIQQRQKQRAGDFIADLEARYAQKESKNSKRRKKRPSDVLDEPPEEAFQKTARRGKKTKVNN